ncbi:hypothetical protein M6B38_390810 [Iris pallida]|uniref:Uncharacterized protein n=1 Tax=Iris pallida TaxID=29817 RepID=A0AAX6FZK2_IRIPA|nr:hypothetical protein M6B38_390810 [Iris pallida]
MLFSATPTESRFLPASRRARDPSTAAISDKRQRTNADDDQELFLPASTQTSHLLLDDDEQ